MPSGFPAPPVPTEPSVPLQAFEVTGSRIRRTDFDTPTPVVRISVAELEATGTTKVEDFIRELPFAFAAPNFTGVTNFQPGLIGLNARGLGLGGVLPLINGRRISYFGQAGAASLAYDIGSLPLAGLESIEILKDGASAIYGSDAVGGVINYKLSRSFQGTSLRTHYRTLNDTDLGERGFRITHGIQRPRGSWVVAVEVDESNSVLFSDVRLSRSEDKRDLGGYDWSAPFTYPANITLPTGTAGVPPSLTGVPIAPGRLNADGTLTLMPTSTPQVGDFNRVPAPTTNGLPTQGDTRNGLDRAPYSTFLPAIASTSLSVLGDWRLGSPEAATAFIEVGYRNRKIGTTYEPGPVNLSGERGFGDGPGGQLIIPAQNPFNPFGIPIVAGAFFLPEAGPYENTMTAETPRLVLGLRGNAPGGWDWEVAATGNRSRISSRWDNFLSDQSVQDALSGRSGGYLNPFGPNDPAVLEAIRVNLQDLQIAWNRFFDARATGPVADWRGGEVRLVVGGEYRTEGYEHWPDQLRQNGGLINLARRPLRDYERAVSSGFAELNLPFGSRGEVQLAARGEKSGAFDWTIKPKISARVRLVRGLALRASYSESLRLPELLQLRAPITETFATVFDPLRTDLGPYLVRLTNGGNPLLQPETTHSSFVGITMDVPKVKGLSLSVDAWSFDQKDLVAQIGAQNLLYREAADGTSANVLRGPSPAPGKAGEVLEVRDIWSNFNLFRTKGLDIELAFKKSFGQNQLSVRASTSLIDELKTADFRRVFSGMPGYTGTPRLRINAAGEWRRGGFSAGWSTRYYSEMRATPPPGTARYVMPTTLFHNASVSMRVGRNARMLLTIENVLNDSPPMDYGNRFGFTSGYFSNLSRMVQLAVEFSLPRPIPHGVVDRPRGGRDAL